MTLWSPARTLNGPALIGEFVIDEEIMEIDGVLRFTLITGGWDLCSLGAIRRFVQRS